MKYFTLALVLILMNVTGYSQSSKKKGKGDYYVEIKDTSFSNSKPDRGATLTGYYKKDSVVKVVTWFGFNYGDVTRTYYYWDSKLIMVSEIQKLYNTNPATPVNPDSIKSNYEGRYIFVEGKLKDMKQTGTYSFADTPTDKPTMEKMLLDFSDKYIKALDEKRAKKKSRMKWADPEN